MIGYDINEYTGSPNYLYVHIIITYICNKVFYFVVVVNITIHVPIIQVYLFV